MEKNILIKQKLIYVDTAKHMQYGGSVKRTYMDIFLERMKPLIQLQISTELSGHKRNAIIYSYLYHAIASVLRSSL